MMNVTEFSLADARLMPNDLTQGDIGHHALAAVLSRHDADYR
jgi:hypothetical protein